MIERAATVGALLCGLSLHAQVRPMPDSVAQGELAVRIPQQVVLTGGFEYNANTLFNELPAAYWRGAYLDRALRERTERALRPRNSAGYALQADLWWTGSSDPTTRAWRPHAAVAHRELMGIRFAPDLYRLTFFGNARFEGERADLGPTRFTHIRYQAFGGGMAHNRTGSWFRGDVLVGQSLATADLRWAGLYTGASGQVLRAGLKGEYQVSDTASSAWGRNNGLGAAVSGTWHRRLSPTSPWAFEAGVEHFGFIHWNRNSLALQRDTIIAFTGFTVANVLDLGDAFTGTEDLLDTLGLRSAPAAVSTWAPFLLHIALNRRLNATWTLWLRAEQRNLPGHVPRVEAMAFKRWTSGWGLGAALAWGGTGGVQLPVHINRTFAGRRLRFHAGTSHLPGFLMGRTRGFGAHFGLAAAF